MGKDRVLFDVTEEYIDEDSNIFQARLNARKYGHSFEIFLNDKLLYKQCDDYNSELYLNMPPDSSFEDKKRFCTDCYGSFYYLGQKIINNEKIKVTMNELDYFAYQVIARRFFDEGMTSLQDKTKSNSKPKKDSDIEEQNVGNTSKKTNETLRKKDSSEKKEVNLENAPDIKTLRKLWELGYLQRDSRHRAKAFLEVVIYLIRDMKKKDITGIELMLTVEKKNGGQYREDYCDKMIKKAEKEIEKRSRYLKPDPDKKLPKPPKKLPSVL